jgi:hypothetical protein
MSKYGIQPEDKYVGSRDITHAEPVDGKAEHGGYNLERRKLNGTDVWEIIPKDSQVVPPNCEGTWLELRYLTAKIDYHNSKVK